jgi:hypothetical protein
MNGGQSSRAESPSPPRLVSTSPHPIEPSRGGGSALHRRHALRFARLRNTQYAIRNVRQPSPSYLIIITRSAPEPEPEAKVETVASAYHVELTRETGERSVVGFERVMEGDAVKSLSVCLWQEMPEPEKPTFEEVERDEKKLESNNGHHRLWVVDESALLRAAHGVGLCG